MVRWEVTRFVAGLLVDRCCFRWILILDRVQYAFDVYDNLQPGHWHDTATTKTGLYNGVRKTLYTMLLRLIAVSSFQPADCHQPP
jgi:hypothetical protein